MTTSRDPKVLQLAFLDDEIATIERRIVHHKGVVADPRAPSQHALALAELMVSLRIARQLRDLRVTIETEGAL